MDWKPILDFLVAQGPFIIALVYSYMNGKVIRAEQSYKITALQKQIEDNHAAVQAKFAGMSDADVIKSELKVSSPGRRTIIP